MHLPSEAMPCIPTWEMMNSTAAALTAIIAARPGFFRRCRTSSLTYRVPSQPLYMNTVMRKPSISTPLPLMPCRLNQDDVIGTVPAWWPSTQIRPQIAKTSRMAYSIMPMATWVRAVIRMPMIEMIIMTRTSPVAMRMFPHSLFAFLLNTASTDGPTAVTGVSVPNRVPASISQPVI